MKSCIGVGIAGLCAGAISGLFGAGGGMVLVPLMSFFTNEEDQTLFSCSVLILLPVCIVSLLFAQGWQDFNFSTALPYLLGSLTGGICTGLLGKRIPVKWLHRVLGLLILWGGIRYLC